MYLSMPSALVLKLYPKAILLRRRNAPSFKKRVETGAALFTDSLAYCTASGVVFLTLEDETGVSNIVVWKKTYEQFRATVMGGRLLQVSGHLQREGIVVHLIAQDIKDMSYKLSELGHPMDHTVGETLPQADNVPRTKQPASAGRAFHPRDQAKKLFPSRDFH